MWTMHPGLDDDNAIMHPGLYSDNDPLSISEKKIIKLRLKIREKNLIELKPKTDLLSGEKHRSSLRLALDNLTRCLL